MPRPYSFTRRVLTAVIALSALAIASLAPVLQSSGSSASAATIGIQRAADLSTFDAGNIISDSVFFNSGTMTENDVAQFLRGKVPNCQAGYVCLKDFSQTTNAKAPDAYCSGYDAAANESSARIIIKVAQSCGINPQALLVTLQKEQGLVTHTWPSDWRYTIAMGQGCPDTAACDTRYYGFQNQVYGAARQFKIYAEGRYFTYYAPGKTWNILFNPNRGCGSSPVYVANKATAGLYYYTPYQPNAAALRAGYGEGDGCSSYGNRNFFQYFTDWFGSTRLGTHGAIANVWSAQGGYSGWIGGPVEEMVWDPANGGGWYQQFANATIYYSVSGASAVLKSASLINSTYEAAGRVQSGYGWPTANETCASGGCYVPLQHGSIAWSNRTGAVTPIVGTMNWAWRAGGAVSGAMGAPLSAERYIGNNGGGWAQTFHGGTIFIKAGGTTTSLLASSALAQRYDALGGPASGLGWPVGDQTCATGSGCAISFDGGALSWDKASGSIHQVSGTFGQTWAAGGSAANWVGPATSDMKSVAGGWVQQFRNGTYYLRSGGTLVAWKTFSALHDAYKSRGAESGALGWPTSGESCGSGVCSVSFDNGILSWDAATGAISTLAEPYLTAWRGQGGASGWSGAPQKDAVATVGGSSQEFRNAFAYAKQGAAPVFHKRSSALAATYRSMNGPTGDLGWPTSAETCGNGECVLTFERGSLVWSSATGAITRK